MAEGNGKGSERRSEKIQGRGEARGRVTWSETRVTCPYVGLKISQSWHISLSDTLMQNGSVDGDRGCTDERPIILDAQA
jgi:hypothetical protein